MFLCHGNIVMHHMRKVTIPDDAIVFIKLDKFKSNKLIFHEKIEICPELYIKSIIQGYKYECLQCLPVSFKTKELYMKIVEMNGTALKYVPSMLKDKKLCTLAVESNYSALEYVPDELKDKKMCMKSVAKHGFMLNCVVLC